MLATRVEHHIVDGDINGVLGNGRLDLVGRAFQMLRAVDVLVHFFPMWVRWPGRRPLWQRLLRRFDHLETNNLAV